MAGLTRENFEKGMLIDDEWMAGISRELDRFSVFVVDHRSGNLLAQQDFPEIDAAIAAVNQIPRSWKFESASGCSGERCGEGKCKGEACKIYSGPKKDPVAGACGVGCP